MCPDSRSRGCVTFCRNLCRDPRGKIGGNMDLRLRVQSLCHDQFQACVAIFDMGSLRRYESTRRAQRPLRVSAIHRVSIGILAGI